MPLLIGEASGLEETPTTGPSSRPKGEIATLLSDGQAAAVLPTQSPHFQGSTSAQGQSAHTVTLGHMTELAAVELAWTQACWYRASMPPYMSVALTRQKCSTSAFMVSRMFCRAEGFGVLGSALTMQSKQVLSSESQLLGRDWDRQ